MTLVKRNNTDFFPTIFDELLNTDWFGGVSNVNTTSPAVNVVEKDDAFEIAIAAPGMHKEDFEVTLDNDTLTIIANRKTENKEVKGRYTRKEFGYGNFKRSFHLNDTIDSAAINGDYKDGILAVSLPKREEAKAQPKRLIEIA